MYPGKNKLKAPSATSLYSSTDGYPMRTSLRHRLRTGLFELFAITLCIQPSAIYAQQAPIESPAKIDQSVLSTLKSLYGTASTVAEHIDLTAPFESTSQWTLVAATEVDKSNPNSESSDGTSPISICFVKNGVPDCSEDTVREKYRAQGMGREQRTFYELSKSKIVHQDSSGKNPLLLLKTCTAFSFDGDCGKATFLYEYDRTKDNFRLVFFNLTPRNNNQDTRFMENGPLVGSIVVVYPTNNAPYTYYVEVYRPSNVGDYKQVLRYRGKTGYNDGNPLPVIDSEMPEILRRLGMWKPGDAPPSPQKLPDGCTQIVMRKGVEWCD
jgi:hypothetical protein